MNTKVILRSAVDVAIVLFVFVWLPTLRKCGSFPNPKGSKAKLVIEVLCHRERVHTGTDGVAKSRLVVRCRHRNRGGV